jgi:diguanylate cyclase (GGDEF)-like protein
MVEGSRPGQIVGIGGDRLTIGRGRKADLHVDDPALSRVHAELVRWQGEWHVRDLASTNGTWVGSVRVSSLMPVKDGDRVKLGQSTTFRVSVHDEHEQRSALELYESAVTDPLTRLYNRRYLNDRLAGEFAYSERHGTPLSILLIDVDHFKPVNDTYGHSAGDVVLRVLAGSIKRMVRAEDIVARFGGEEFALVARGIGHQNALIVAERIRRLVSGLEITWNDDRIKVTLSGGVATNNGHRSYPDLANLLEAADRALYRAKNSGRNRVVGD